MYYPGTKILGFSAGGAGAVQFNMNNVGTGQSGNVLNYTNGAVINPVGVVQDFAGSTAPTGWFLCFGQAVSRTGYPELFTVIGTTFGTGDGSTTFNLPDCRGRATFAVDNMGGTPANRLPGATAPGITGGNNNAAVTLTQANLPNVNFPVSGITLNDPTHTHTYTTDHAGGLNNQVIDTGNAANFTNQSGAINAASTGITIATQGSANSGGSGTPINALPPTIVFNKIIFAGRP
jgi:microcystin-dependent protein